MERGVFGGAGGGVEECDVCWELRARLGKVTRIQAQEMSGRLLLLLS